MTDVASRDVAFRDVARRPNVMVVDAAAASRATWREALAGTTYELRTFDDARAALAHAAGHAVDVALVDLRLPEINGLELLVRLAQVQPDMMSVLVTERGNVGSAVEAAKLGAFDVLAKPIHGDLPAARDCVARAVAHSRSRRCNALISDNKSNAAAHPRSASDKPRALALLGTSTIAERLRQRIAAIADCNTPALILGGAGCEQQSIARRLHAANRSRSGPFVLHDCAGLRADDASPTDSHRPSEMDFVRLLGAASGGTLFVDHLNVATPEQQRTLVAAVEFSRQRRHTLSRADGSAARWLMAATPGFERANGDTHPAAAALRDLGAFEVVIAPLRERQQDLPAMCYAVLDGLVLDGLVPRCARRVEGFEDEALACLLRHDWPGNYEELAKTLEYAISEARTTKIRAVDLPARLILKAQGDGTHAETTASPPPQR